MQAVIAPATTTMQIQVCTTEALHIFVEEIVIDAAGGRRDNRPVRGWAVLVVVAYASGCGFDVEFGGSNTDGGIGDGSGSAIEDGGYGCYGTGLVIVCPLTQPPPNYTVTVSTQFDTNVGGNCTTVNGSINNGPIQTACVVVAEDISVMADLRGIGPRPIVFVATKSMSIQGSIDVASHRDSRGAGNSTTVCVNGVGPSGLGGGAGGAFGGEGGGGGNDENFVGGSTGPLSTPPTSLRGGCRGQGGAGAFGIGGDGGHGGGVFYAIAGMQIDVTGVINASGEGGRGGTFGTVAGGGGGGGGGSGGMIGLDAAMIRVGGQVFANGGGGGGGSSGFENAGGGKDPQGAQAVPEGGTNANGAGRGGIGTAATTLGGGAGEPRSAFGAGGGGGGGGAGHVQVYGTLVLDGPISPPPI
jgi:hypothetical protein